MLTLTSDQDALLGATSKKVSWLFTVTVDSVTYYWSTKNYTFGSGAELVENGTFTSDTMWTKTTADWTISGGTANKAIGASPCSIYQTEATLVAGVTYEVTFDITEFSGTGYIQAQVGSGLGTQVSSNGSYTQYIEATGGSQNILFYAEAAVGCKLDNVSVKEFITYENRVVPESFGGVELNRAMSEYGIQAPSQLNFEVSNDDASLTASDFEGQDVQLDMVINDWSDEQVVASWKFTVVSANEVQGTIYLACEDFLSGHLEGDYPNTKLVSQLVTDPALPNDNVCVPMPFGTAYVPLRSVYVTDQRYYLLGLSAHTYTITEVRSPEQWGSVSTWVPGGAVSFNQSTKTLDGESYRVFQPIIADSDGDGTPDAPGLWTEGGLFLDPYVEFTRNDTATTTNPADVIEQVLLDMGLAASEIDTGSGSTFETAAAVFTGWGLEFNGAFFVKMARNEALAMLLLMCHSTLRVTDKLELHVLDKASQMTIDSSYVLKTDTVGETTYSYTPTVEEAADYGFVAYVAAGTPQGRMLKLKVAAKGTYDESSGETLELPFINDNQDAQRAGILYFQRVLGQVGQCSFDAVEECLVLQPEDVITINDTAYGESFSCIVDSVRIGRELNVTVGCIRNKYALDDWDDLSPTVISVAADDSESVWTPVISGPSGDDIDGGYAPNLVHGKLRVGAGADYILIDSDESAISLYEGNTLRVSLGDLGSRGIGLLGKNAAGTEIFSIDGDSALIAGWNFTTTKLYTDEIEIDSGNQRIRSTDYVSGPYGKGFSLEHDLLEVGNIRARGLMQNVSFRKDAISAVAGSLLITKSSDVLASDMTALDSSTLTVSGVATFSAGDCLRIKDGTYHEWLYVSNVASAPTYTVTRDRGGLYSANNNPAWKKGTAVVNYGSTGSYGISLTASDTNYPHLSIFETGTTPWVSVTEIIRLGQLNGFAGYSSSAYGFAVYFSSTNYVKIDATNGVQISVSGADGLQIQSGADLLVKSGGNITLEGGGDLILTKGSTYSEILWKSGSTEYAAIYFENDYGLCFEPEIGDTHSVYFGITAEWKNFYVFTFANIGFSTYSGSTYLGAGINCSSDSSVGSSLAAYQTSGHAFTLITYCDYVSIYSGRPSLTLRWKFDSNYDMYLYYGSIVLPASEYVNFGGTLGSGGYGFRDNGTDIEVKDSGDDWFRISRFKVKTDTGHPTGYTGLVEINTYDNKVYIYADGDWRQLATW